MLGYVVAEGRGAADLLIRTVAGRLHGAGVSLAGAVQVNAETVTADRCRMDLHILSGQETIRISQDLGALSDGCRLDPDGLERGVGLVEVALRNGADCLILNKFGRQEAEGRGFRPLIGEALLAGIPVLTAVNAGNLDAFLDFAGGLACRLPEDPDAVVDWCLAQSPG